MNTTPILNEWHCLQHNFHCAATQENMKPFIATTEFHLLSGCWYFILCIIVRKHLQPYYSDKNNCITTFDWNSNMKYALFDVYSNAHSAPFIILSYFWQKSMLAQWKTRSESHTALVVHFDTLGVNKCSYLFIIFKFENQFFSKKLIFKINEKSLR